MFDCVFTKKNYSPSTSKHTFRPHITTSNTPITNFELYMITTSLKTVTRIRFDRTFAYHHQHMRNSCRAFVDRRTRIRTDRRIGSGSFDSGTSDSGMGARDCAVSNTWVMCEADDAKCMGGFSVRCVSAISQ